MCPSIDSMVSLTPTLVLLGSMLCVKESRGAILSMLDDQLNQKFIEKTKAKFGYLETTQQCTIFVPPDEEIAKTDPFNVQYHIANLAHRLYSLPPHIVSERKAGPFIYITKVRGDDEDQLAKVFVNQAEIKMSSTKYIKDPNQALFHINRVLEPLRVGGGGEHDIFVKEKKRHPNAYELVLYDTGFKLDNHRLKTQNQSNGDRDGDGYDKADDWNTMLNKRGFYTFFIPTTAALQTAGITHITTNIGRLHVYERCVLFPYATDEDYELECKRHAEEEEYAADITEETRGDPTEETTEGKVTKKSAATEEKTILRDKKLKCFVSFAYEKTSKHPYVRSMVVEGNQYERSVVVEFAKPNIPVKNGVVHLIKNVLCHIDEKVVSAIKNPRITNAKYFSTFAAGIKSKIWDDLDREALLTAFIPINHTHINEFMSSLEEGSLITAGVSEIPLKFYFLPDPHEKGKERAIVECRGHNTSVELFDMDKENGIVHLVYDMLGFFSGTIYDRMASDEFQSYRDTLRIADFSGFNEEIKKTNQKYTYFVPSREAWESIEHQYPPAKKHLFTAEFRVESRYLLERHLVINDEYTAEDLATMTRTVARAIVLPLLRDFLRIKVSRIRDYLIRYNSLEIKIVHRDIYCSNGIFHVIDSPFLEKEDLTIIRQVSETDRLRCNVRFSCASFVILTAVNILFYQS
uniref:FAS1 domain-containing protein n=1 Tax=Glossina pallidipes TaxID=7398 RepID=A0A1A9ZGK7_GLOPL